MSFHVPANQAVCWSVYWPSVMRESECTYDECEKYVRQMMRAFDSGEPIWMAAAELKFLVEANRNYRKEKTPKQLAKSFVQVS